MIVNEISLVIQRIIEDGKEKGNTKGNSLDVREIPSQQLFGKVSTASQGTSNIPFHWFLLLGCNSQTAGPV